MSELRLKMVSPVRLFLRQRAGTNWRSDEGRVGEIFTESPPGLHAQRFTESLEIPKKSVMLGRWLLLICAFLSAIPTSALASDSHYYTVRQGEIASEVLRVLRMVPIYGRDGTLVRLISANPKVPDIDKIVAGQRINLPRDLVEYSLSRGKIVVAESGEVFAANELRNDFPIAAERDVDKSVEKEQHENVEVLAPRKIAAETPVVMRVEAPAPTPPPVSIPAPVPVLPPPKPLVTPTAFVEDPVAHTVALSAEYRMSEFHAVDKMTDTVAQILTARDIFLSAAWKQAWDESFTTYQSFGIRNVTFEPSAPGSKKIGTGEKSISHFEFGLAQKITERVSVGYSFGYGTELFVRGLNSTTVVVDAVPIPSVGLEANVDLLRRGGTSFGLLAQGRYLFRGRGDMISIEPGFQYSGALYLKKKSSSMNLRLDLGYEMKSQETSITRQDESSAYGILQMEFPIFESERSSNGGR